MKIKLVLIIMVFGFISKNAFAEDDVNMYKCKVQYYDSNEVINQYTGWLYDVSDSTVLISHNSLIKDYYTSDIDFDEVNYDIIHDIKLRKKWRIPKHIIGGIIIGATAGAIIGYLSGDPKPAENRWEYTREDKAIIGGLVFGLTGSIVGLITGSLYKDYQINGKYQDFQHQKQSFEQYSIEKQMNLPENNLRE